MNDDTPTQGPTAAQQREMDIAGMIGALQHFMAECDKQQMNWQLLRSAAENLYELRSGKSPWACGNPDKQPTAAGIANA